MVMLSKDSVQLHPMWGHPVSGITVIVQNHVVTVAEDVVQVVSVSLIRVVHQTFWQHLPHA